MWISQDVGNSKYLLYRFSERLKDCYFQDWLSKINQSYEEKPSKIILGGHLFSTYFFCIVI